MAYDVHIHVVFACDANEGVAALATKHLPAVRIQDQKGEPCREAVWFLEDLEKRKGRNLGPKGGLSLWGMVGNYTNAEAFVEALSAFWLELLTEVEDGPLDFEHVLVFEEQEGREQATALEIYLDETTGQLTIKRHECPFAFMQM